MLLRLIDKYCIKSNYENELALFISSSSKRHNPQEKWHNLLFGIGLVIECFAIIYYVGFHEISIQIEGKLKTSNLFSIITDDFIATLFYISTLSAMILHQWYIRNTFLYINEITYDLNTKENNHKFYFPKNLMFSNVEYRIRQFFFLFLAIITGEIPYILLVSEKVLKPIFFPSSRYVLDSTIIFIFACCLISFLIFVWDIIVYRASYLCKKVENDDLSWLSIEPFLKIMIFTVSGFFSLGMWLLILAYILTSNIKLMETIFYFFGGTYILIVLLIRLVLLKSNPLKGKF